MYPSGSVAGPAVGPAYNKPRRKRVPPGNRPQEEDYGSKRGRNAFLKQQFPRVGAQSVTRNRESEGCNYLTQKNYDYLLECARRYAHLTGKKLKHAPGNDIGESIAKLYHDLESILPGDIGINFDIVEDRLIFVLWKYYRWGEYSLYWIPVKFVENLPTPLRRLAISFLHQFRESMRFDTTNHNDELEFILEWQLECVDENFPDEAKDILETVQSYHEGRIYKLMERIGKRNYHPDLAKALQEYEPANDYEKELVELMTDGLQFIGEKIPTIFQYAYDPRDDEEEDDNHPVTLDQRFMYIYEDDRIIESYIEYLNDMAGNYSEIHPCATLILRPDMDEVFAPEDFPKQFFGYMNRLVDFLKDN